MKSFYLSFFYFFTIVLIMGSMSSCNIGTQPYSFCGGVLSDLQWAPNSDALIIICQKGESTSFQTSPFDSYLYFYKIDDKKTSFVKKYPYTNINGIKVISENNFIGLFENHSTGEHGIWKLWPELVFIDKGSDVAVDYHTGNLFILENYLKTIMIRLDNSNGDLLKEIISIQLDYAPSSMGIDYKNDIIAFSANLKQETKGVTYHIYTLSMDGGVPLEISSESFSSSPTFSPDGQLLAFCSGNNFNEQNLSIYNINGKSITRYNNIGCNAAAWSPNGESIAVIEDMSIMKIIPLQDL